MKIDQLQDKLNKLREQLIRLETEGTENIRQKRILADMGDDYRENEGAKLVMEDHEFLHMRISDLKREIGEMKRRIIKLRS